MADSRLSVSMSTTLFVGGAWEEASAESGSDAVSELLSVLLLLLSLDTLDVVSLY